MNRLGADDVAAIEPRGAYREIARVQDYSDLIAVLRARAVLLLGRARGPCQAPVAGP